MKVSDIEELASIIEQWWESCYKQAEGNAIDMIAYACGWLPLELDEEMRLHFKEKTYIIKRIE